MKKDDSEGKLEVGTAIAESFAAIKTAKRVVLLRHGQSTWNAEGRIQVSSDFSVLTAKGESQAEISRQMLVDDLFDEEMNKNAKTSSANPSGSWRHMQEVECPTCTVHLQVQVPPSGSETIECSVFSILSLSVLTDLFFLVLASLTCVATKHPQLRSLKFNCIVFNFPRVVFSDPKPPRDAQLSKHQGLTRAFLANAKQMIRGDGQIHIIQCSGHHLEWNIKPLGTSKGLQLVEESPFRSKDYPGYCAKYGLYGCGGDGSFGCNPPVTYKFQLPSNNIPKRKRTRRRQ